MIDSGEPLRHTVVVGVLRPECELAETPRGRRDETSRASTDAAVAADVPQSRTAFAYQPQANVSFRRGRPRRAKHRSDEIVVEIRGPHRELSLLQRKYSVMPPGGLAEGGKGHWVLATELGVGCLRLLNMSEDL